MMYYRLGNHPVFSLVQTAIWVKGHGMRSLANVTSHWLLYFY